MGLISVIMSDSISVQYVLRIIVKKTVSKNEALLGYKHTTELSKILLKRKGLLRLLHR